MKAETKAEVEQAEPTVEVEQVEPEAETKRQVEAEAEAGAGPAAEDAWRTRAHFEREPEDEDVEAIYLGMELYEDERAGGDEEDADALLPLPVVGLLLADDGAAGTTRLFSYSHEHRIKAWKVDNGASAMSGRDAFCSAIIWSTESTEDDVPRGGRSPCSPWALW